MPGRARVAATQVAEQQRWQWGCSSWRCLGCFSSTPSLSVCAPQPASTSLCPGNAWGYREGNGTQTSAEMEGEERAGREGGRGVKSEDEEAGGARPSGEPAGALTLPRIPESCSMVTYWAERSKVCCEGGLWDSQAEIGTEEQANSDGDKPSEKVSASPGVMAAGGDADAAERRAWTSDIPSPFPHHAPSPGSMHHGQSSAPPCFASSLHRCDDHSLRDPQGQKAKSCHTDLPAPCSAPELCSSTLRASPAWSRQEALPSWVAPTAPPCSAAAKEIAQPREEVSSEHWEQEAATWPAHHSPKQATRACSGAGTSLAAGGTASKKEC